MLGIQCCLHEQDIQQAFIYCCTHTCESPSPSGALQVCATSSRTRSTRSRRSRACPPSTAPAAPPAPSPTCHRTQHSSWAAPLGAWRTSRKLSRSRTTSGRPSWPSSSSTRSRRSSRAQQAGAAAAAGPAAAPGSVARLPPTGGASVLALLGASVCGGGSPLDNVFAPCAKCNACTVLLLWPAEVSWLLHASAAATASKAWCQVQHRLMADGRPPLCRAAAAQAVP